MPLRGQGIDVQYGYHFPPDGGELLLVFKVPEKTACLFEEPGFVLSSWEEVSDGVLVKRLGDQAEQTLRWNGHALATPVLSSSAASHAYMQKSTDPGRVCSALSEVNE